MWAWALLAAVWLFWVVGAYSRLMRLRAAVVRAFGVLDANFLHWAAFWGAFQSDAALADWRSQGGQAHRQAQASLDAANAQFAACLAMARARPLERGSVAALAAGKQVLDGAWAGVLHSSLHPENAIKTESISADPVSASGQFDSKTQREGKSRSATAKKSPKAAKADKPGRRKGAAAASARESVAGAAASAATPVAPPAPLTPGPAPEVAQDVAVQVAAPLEPWAQQHAKLCYDTVAPLEKYNHCVAQHNQAVRQFPASLLAWVLGFDELDAL